MQKIHIFYKNSKKFSAVAENFTFYKPLTANITIPSTVKTAPVTRFSTVGEALFANFDAICAKIKVKSTQKKSTEKFTGISKSAKCEEAPTKAVNVMIKTLVPTAVFNS